MDDPWAFFIVIAAVVPVPAPSACNITASAVLLDEPINIGVVAVSSSEAISPAKPPGDVTVPSSPIINRAVSPPPSKLLIVKEEPSSAAVIFHRSLAVAAFGLRYNPAVEELGPLMETKPSVPEPDFVPGVRIILPPA